jgi:hypothetical protein
MPRRSMKPRPEFTPAAGEPPPRARTKLRRPQAVRSDRPTAKSEVYGPASDGRLKERLLRATNRRPLALMASPDREKALEQAADEKMWKTLFGARRRTRRAERAAERRTARRQLNAKVSGDAGTNEPEA